MIRVNYVIKKIILIICLLCFQTNEASSKNSYVGGVVEYSKTLDANKSLEAELNLKEYLALISSSTVEDIDILVFPESTLNDIETAVFAPEADGLINPCVNNSLFQWSDLLAKLSCAAKSSQTYIVVNLHEKTVCSDVQQLRLEDKRPCPASGENVYNTNLVFDRNGVVISKYRKFNLFGEPKTMFPIRPETGIFTTDFGVTFGQFICFDVLFDKPSLDLVRQGITDFVYPTMWFSELPFLTAVQVQHGWSIKNNVNFLASGASFPKVASAGSGIYHGKSGALVDVMSYNPIRKILKAEIPKINSGLTFQVEPTEMEPTHHDMLNLTIARDYLEPYNTTLVGVNRAYSTELCHGELCCQFHVDVEFQKDLVNGENVKFYVYRLAAFDGTRTYIGISDAGLKVCAVFACTTEAIASCGKRFTQDTTIVDAMKFKTLKITTKYKHNEKVLMMPNTLTTSILPMHRRFFDYQEDKVDQDKNLVGITMDLKNEVSNLYTFAIYGRDFSRDKKQDLTQDELEDLFDNFEKYREAYGECGKKKCE